MKTKTNKYILVIGFLFFLIACSTKKNTFLSRNSHALSTEYNILYNGGIGLDKGLEEVKSNTKDNFWERLSVEKMQLIDDSDIAEKTKNTNFELAETKATKAIQKHSMNIGGTEKNSQIDEAYLLLGKSRYYDQRFIPALDAFNYILYKYPNSDKIFEAKIWREKTNMRLGNDELVIKNTTKLLKENKLKNQVFADANALLSESYLNLEEIDSAVAKLKLAEHFTKQNTEKARYRFILGQLYEELGKKDSAVDCYNSVIKMKRKAGKQYVIQAQARKTQLFDAKSGDTLGVLKTYDKLISDRENRPFLGIIYHQLGLFYDKNINQKGAFLYYNKSLKKSSSDPYLIASNYRNIGNMYFKNKDYQKAAKYYDSTLVKLNPKTRECISIQKTRKNLDEVIEYEEVAKRNDSILNVVSLSETERILYFDKYIDKLKKADEIKKIAEEKEKQRLENIERNNKVNSDGIVSSVQDVGNSKKNQSVLAPKNDGSANTQANTFYFYNPSTVAFGKIEFKKNWGNRTLNTNWRLSSSKTNSAKNDTIIDNKLASENNQIAKEINEKYLPEYYIAKLPKNQIAIDSITKVRNSAYYQLGVIYKEKFKEYGLATSKLEQLLKYKPEEKLILPTMYNLYKIYQITDATKAEAMKNSISVQYPNSRYAQIINNEDAKEISTIETPENVYKKWYTLFQEQQYSTILKKSDELINQFEGDEIVPKFELLKANTVAKLYGLSAYKKALQHIADFYPKSEEGKNAQEILSTQIPLLEKNDFSNEASKNWKILYKINASEDLIASAIEGKINALIINEKDKNLTYSCDRYSETENFITIHGIKTNAYAKTISTTLKENKAYKIENPAIIISDENYKVIQIKKNLETYLTPKKQ